MYTGANPPFWFNIFSIDEKKRKTYVWPSKDSWRFCDDRLMDYGIKRCKSISKINNKLFMKEGNYGMMKKVIQDLSGAYGDNIKNLILYHGEVPEECRIPGKLS